MVVEFKPITAWSEVILDAARPYMNAEVAFYTQVTIPFDPRTGTPPTTEVTVLWRGKARVQQLRTPREIPAAYHLDATRAFRFQLDPLDDPPFFDQGVLARVISGGRDADLTKLQFRVNSSINSSHMAVRTIELTADMDESPAPTFP